MIITLCNFMCIMETREKVELVFTYTFFYIKISFSAKRKGHGDPELTKRWSPAGQWGECWEPWPASPHCHLHSTERSLEHVFLLLTIEGQDHHQYPNFHPSPLSSVIHFIMSSEAKYNSWTVWRHLETCRFILGGKAISL